MKYLFSEILWLKLHPSVRGHSKQYEVRWKNTDLYKGRTDVLTRCVQGYKEFPCWCALNNTYTFGVKEKFAKHYILLWKHVINFKILIKNLWTHFIWSLGSCMAFHLETHVESLTCRRHDNSQIQMQYLTDLQLRMNNTTCSVNQTQQLSKEGSHAQHFDIPHRTVTLSWSYAQSQQGSS